MTWGVEPSPIDEPPRACPPRSDTRMNPAAILQHPFPMRTHDSPTWIRRTASFTSAVRQARIAVCQTRISAHIAACVLRRRVARRAVVGRAVDCGVETRRIVDRRIGSTVNSRSAPPGWNGTQLDWLRGRGR